MIRLVPLFPYCALGGGKSAGYPASAITQMIILIMMKIIMTMVMLKHMEMTDDDEIKCCGNIVKHVIYLELFVCWSLLTNVDDDDKDDWKDEVKAKYSQMCQVPIFVCLLLIDDTTYDHKYVKLTSWKYHKICHVLSLEFVVNLSSEQQIFWRSKKRRLYFNYYFLLIFTKFGATSRGKFARGDNIKEQQLNLSLMGIQKFLKKKIWWINM